MKSTLASLAIPLLVLLLYCWLVWPTPYRTSKLTRANGSTFPVRINRFNGTSDILTEEGWVVLSKNASSRKPAAKPSAASDVEALNLSLYRSEEVIKDIQRQRDELTRTGVEMARDQAMIAEQSAREMREIDREYERGIAQDQADNNAYYESRRRENAENSYRAATQRQAERAMEETRAAAAVAKEDADRTARKQIAIQEEQLHQLQEQTKSLKQIESLKSQQYFERLNAR